MEENKEVFVSEEEAIDSLDKIDNDYKEKQKKEKHKKKVKSPKPKRPKYTRTGERKNKKVIIISLVVVVLIILICLVVGALYFYMEKNNLYKIEDEIVSASKKYYSKVEDNFTGVTFTIKNGKLKNNDIKLKEIPNNGTINIDEDGLISYAISSNNYCLIKNTYDKDSKIKKDKKCSLNESASNYIINVNKDNDDFVIDDETTDFDEELGYASKYYFKGENPDNYIVFSNRCFRIVNIANNGNIKAIYDGYYDEKGCVTTSGGYAMIEKTLFDENSNNILSEENALNKLLKSYVENKTMNDKINFTEDDFSKLANATFYVGSVNGKGTIKEVVENERKNKGKSALTNSEDYYQYKDKIGLLNVSDFLKASADEKCNTINSAYGNSDYDCSKDNYLYLSGYPTWTLNAYSESNNRAWRITANGSLLPVLVSNDSAYIRPVVYIKSNVSVTGNGTFKKPFIVE